MDLHTLLILSCLLVAGNAHDEMPQSECYAKSTDNTHTIECANGNLGRIWDGCIQQGSYRVRCPHNQYPCNSLAGNGKEFSCWKDCTHHGGVKNCLLKEKTSPAVSSNNFLNAFYAQWSRNEKDQLLNKYEITSLIFKETLQVFANMTEQKEYSACFMNDVTSSASPGPQAMFLYSSEVQKILTTLDTQPASNYDTTLDTQPASNYDTTLDTQPASNDMTCLLHHQTNITSTAFVAMAMCANIYGENGQAPVITSVTCIEKPTPPKKPEVKSMPTLMMSSTTTATSRPTSMTSPTTTAPSRATSMIFSTATAPQKYLLIFIGLIILY